MSAYWAILSARFRMLLQYRAAAVAGFGTQLFWGLIRVMIFSAFYHSSTAKQPMTQAEVITYVWLGQAMFTLLPWRIDTDVQAMIRSGTVVYELLRPLDLYSTWYSRAIAMRVAPALLRSVPMFVVAGLFLGLKPPASLECGLAWAGATLGSLFLGAAITNLLTMSMLWTLSGEGIVRIVPSAVFILSGMIIPLPLFPDWAQGVLNFLPFRNLVDTPFRLYMGNIPAAQVWFVLAQQAVWTVGLVALGRWALGRGLRRLVVQGG